MNKIIYFTTAQDIDSYPDFLKKWTVFPNLSNQNFHNKLIRALSLTHEMEVISVRPINKNFKGKLLPYKEVKEKNITWKYILVKQSRVDKLLNLGRRINKALDKNEEGSVVLVDVLNLSLLRKACKVAKRLTAKIYGICTDNPLNISFTSESYNEKLLKLIHSLDGYICLTEKINELLNVNNKPYVLIDGISEDMIIDVPVEVEGDYIFFGGSLMKEYGILSLVDAFEKLNKKKLKLVIAGHHENQEFLDYIKDKQNVVYVGPLDYKSVISYEKDAICCVNPRPINPKIDDYSIPSKVLEYLSVGSITISVENKLLKERYGDAIVWAKSGDSDDLCLALKKALKLSENEKHELFVAAVSLTQKYTSFKTVCNLIDKALF